jgi:hypothetical protein
VAVWIRVESARSQAVPVTDNNTRDGNLQSDVVLGLRLVPEGANDRLLIRMLVRQYPAIVSDYTDSSGSVAVPIWEGHDDGAVTEIDMSGPEFENMRWQSNLCIKTIYDPRGGTIRHGKLVSYEGSVGIVERLAINGREQVKNADGTFQMEPIVAGAHLELEFNPACGSDNWTKFRVRIVPGLPPLDCLHVALFQAGGMRVGLGMPAKLSA